MKKILISGLVAMSLSLASCGDYLDINESPNSPSRWRYFRRPYLPGNRDGFCHVL